MHLGAEWILKNQEAKMFLLVLKISCYPFHALLLLKGEKRDREHDVQRQLSSKEVNGETRLEKKMRAKTRSWQRASFQLKGLTNSSLVCPPFSLVFLRSFWAQEACFVKQCKFKANGMHMACLISKPSHRNSRTGTANNSLRNWGLPFCFISYMCFCAESKVFSPWVIKHLLNI